MSGSAVSRTVPSLSSSFPPSEGGQDPLGGVCWCPEWSHGEGTLELQPFRPSTCLPSLPAWRPWWSTMLEPSAASSAPWTWAV